MLLLRAGNDDNDSKSETSKTGSTKLGRRLLLYVSPFGERTNSAWNSMSKFQQLRVELLRAPDVAFTPKEVYRTLDEEQHKIKILSRRPFLPGIRS